MVMTGLGPKIGTVCEKATNVVVGMASKMQNIVEHNLVKFYKKYFTSMLMVETCFSWNWLVIFLSGSWRNFRVRWRRLLWYFGSHDTEWFACFLIFGCIFDHADHVDELPQIS